MNYRIVILILATSIVASCGKDQLCNCLKKTGDEITEVRSVSSFSSIEMNNNVDVVIIPDTFFSIKVTSGKNLLDGIKTEVNNNRLEIRNINKCNWLRDFENRFIVEVTVRDLNQITNNGSGNLTFTDTLITPDFQVDNWNGTGTLSLLLNCNETRFKLHTGPADIVAGGRSAVGYIYSAGNGYCDTKNLINDYCYVTTKSTGDCFVSVSKEVGVTIEYVGDVYYSGNPYKVDQQVTGSGKLIRQ